jgi:hypothetical protein
MESSPPAALPPTLFNAVKALSPDHQFWLLFADIALLFTLKAMLIVISYKTICMGHQLLNAGIKGEFKFKSEFKGAKADLASASPGIFFVFLGIVAMIAAIYLTSAVSYKFGGGQGGQQPELENGVPESDPFDKK